MADPQVLPDQPLAGPSFDELKDTPIDLPDKLSPLKDTYHQTMDLQPDMAAQVMKLSKQLNEHPAVVADNMDEAKKAAGIPPDSFFAKLEQQYPKTANYLTDPTKMAVAKDDIHNLANTEGLVRGYSFGDTLWRSVNAGSAKLFADVAKAPATALDLLATPGNLLYKAIGRPDLEWQSPEWLSNNPVAKFYTEQAKAWTPPALSGDVVNQIKTGDFAGAGQTMAAQFAEGAPSLALLIMSGGAGYAKTGITAMGAMGATSALDRNRAQGVEPAVSDVNALYHGAFAASLANWGALGPFRKWEAQIAQAVGKDSARKVIISTLNAMGHSGATFGAAMGSTSLASDFADVATGVNPDAMTGSVGRAAGATLSGFAQGAALVGPAAVTTGLLRGSEIRRSEQARDIYLAMGKSQEASALRKRLPDEARAFVEEVTKGTPLETIGVPAEKFDTYFQSKNIDPNEMAKELGVDAQLPLAREAGSDVQIPLATWADKMVGTPHYEALKDDIRFRPEDLTINEAKQQADVAGKMIQAEADKAVKENPALQEGRDFIYNDLRRQIDVTGQVTPAQADAQAQVSAAMITKMAADRGMDPKVFYEQGPIKVTAGDLTNAEMGQTQSILKQEGVKPEGGNAGEASLPTSPDQKTTEQVPPGQPGTSPLSEESLRTFFPGPSDPSLKSITQHPDYFKMSQKAGEVVNRYANERGIAPNPQLAKDLFVELHDALGEITKAKREDRAAVAADILKRYPNIESDFVTLKNQLWSDQTPEYFDLFVKEKNRFQGGPGDPETDPRGFINFTPKGAIISLVKSDASTFPHELAHYWLKNFHDFIQTDQASEQHRADWKVLADWLKVEDGKTKLTSAQHEQFAKGFEAYLREGKAPSEDLRGVFAKFRRWLTRLYKDPITLGIELNNNVRGVMDRMLASDNEIAFAERNMGMDLGKEFEGIDPKVREKLVALREQAHEAAVTQLLGQQMAELSVDHQTMLSKEAGQARVKAEDAVRGSDIQKSIRAIEKTFGRDPREIAGNWRIGKLNAEDQATLEQMAAVRGYSSADEMTYKIMNEPPVEKQVQAAVDQHMAQFADLRNTDKIREEALKAVHGEKQTELMAMEQGIFQSMVDEAQGRIVDNKRRAQQARLEAEAVKEKAKGVIASKPVAEAGQFMPYFTAERNAAVKVQKALLAKDYETAATAKRQQMLNHALASEAFKVRAEIDKAMRFFDRFASRKQDLKDIPYGFIRQIDTLLSDRGLAAPREEDAKTYLTIAQDMAAKGEDAEEIAHRTGWMQDAEGQWKPEALADTVVRIQNDYRNVAIPDSVLSSSPVPYRRMPLSDFRDLKAAVQALNAVGRGYDRFLDENIKMDRKEAAARFREFVEKNIGTSYLEARDIGTKAGSTRFTKGIDAISHLPDAAIPSLVNLLSLTDVIDAKTPDGLGKQLIYRPLLHGEEGKAKMVEQAVKDVNELLKTHFAKDEYEKLRKDSVYIASRDRSMTKDEILGFTLNWGNEHGRQRLTDGYNLTPEQTKEILSKVPKNHWEFAQSVWDYMDSFWPKIVAQQQKVAGETPQKVKALAVETPDGSFRGGYYPLAYDSQKSNDIYRTIDARNALYKTLGSAVAHTEHGFTSSRVSNYSAPVRLDSHVIFDHLEDVIHDLNFRSSVVDVNGFLRQKDTREAIINALGVDALKAIQTHLKWVASHQYNPLNGADAIIRKMRMGATVATLGLRPLQAPLSAGGNIINAMHEIGPVNFAGAVKEFVADRDTNTKFVNDRSMLMSQRATVRDRDLTDLAKRWAAKDTLFEHYTFYMDSLSDEAVSYPLWLSVYRGAVGQHGEQTAIDLAQEAVVKTMGSGRVLDQANIQRGTESQKLFSWWYSWSGMMFNRMWREGKFAGLEYRKGNVSTALAITAQAGLYGWVLQSANENLFRELFRNAQNVDDDKRFKRVMLRAVMQPISYVPIYRDIAQYALGKTIGQPGGFTTPFQDAVESMANPLAEMGKAAIGDKEMSPRFWEDTMRVAAITAKYPQIINTWAFNFIDFLNNEGDLTWRDLASRRTKS